MAYSSDGIQFINEALIVTDLERSVRFYCEVFGFTKGTHLHREGEAGSSLAITAGTPEGCRYHIQILARPDIIVGMGQMEVPESVSRMIRDPLFRVARGIAFTFYCPDINATAARAEELGGKIVYEGMSSTKDADGQLKPTVILHDPDGYRIQLSPIPLEKMRPMMMSSPHAESQLFNVKK